MNLTKLIGSFKFHSNRFLKERLSKADLGILKVAFMVAALDGEVTEAEYAAFDALAKKCRGYTADGAAEALDAAMRSAGYLMLLSKRVKTPVLARAFIREAKAALPDGFAYLTVEDVRRALVIWTAMGLSDGDYSVREKACIEALRKHFAELKVERADEEYERAMALSPTFRMAYGPGSERLMDTLIPKDFVTRVQELVAQYGDSADAEKELKALINA